MKKRNAAASLLLFIIGLFSCVYLFAQKSLSSFDRESFYAAISSASSSKIDEQLNLLKNNSIEEKNAFEGALLMRKAGLVSPPSKKLNLFKQGNKKLETAIKKDADNAEYRFLRLMIQENAPAVLHYKSNIKSDSEFVRQSYKNLSPVLQKAILDYCKISKTLKATDL